MGYRQLISDPVAALRGRPGWNRLWLLLALMAGLELVSWFGLTARLAELHDEVLQLHALREGGRPAGHAVLVVIDEQEHRERYGQRSPLDPALVSKTLEQIALARPRAVAVDLDLSPINEADAVLRGQQTDRALIQMGATVPVVVACPQSASAPTGMTPIESRWVAALQARGVAIGQVDLDDRGLYASAAPASLASTLVRRLGSGPASTEAVVNCAHEPLSNASRSPLAPRALVQVRAQDLGSDRARALLKDRVVVFGGTFGPADAFQLRGSSAPVYGVALHAWQIEAQLLRASWPRLPEALAFLARLAIAWIYATALAWAWRQVADPRLSVPGRWVAYLVTTSLVVAGPVLTLSLGWQAPELGQALKLSSVFVGILFSAIIAAPLLVDLRTREAASSATASSSSAAAASSSDDAKPARPEFSLHGLIDRSRQLYWRQRLDQAALVGTRWLMVLAAAVEVGVHMGALAAIALVAGLLAAGARRAS